MVNRRERYKPLKIFLDHAFLILNGVERIGSRQVELIILLRGDGVLRYQGRLYVPDVYGLRDRILEEAHGSHYSIHLGSMKMYHDQR